MDTAVDAAGVRDGEAARLAGFPYLRASRYLASFSAEPLDEAQFQAWVDAMIELDREARSVERANLSSPAHASAAEASQAALVEGCGRALRDRDLGDASARARLREAAVVPDDYDTWKRVVGLYALSSVPFAMGVRDYEQGVRGVFAAPLDALPNLGMPVRYEPQAMSPEIPSEVLGHAPELVVDTVDDSDRIGAPLPGITGPPTASTARPIGYWRFAATRYRGESLKQIVYTFWFPARPTTGPFDLLGGHLDGITWRVTLGRDGAPVLYDSIHNCGCYHMFFPTPRAQPLPNPGGLDEWAFVPQRLAAVVPGERIVLHVAARTHYVQRVTLGPPAAGERRGTARGYALAPYGLLRSVVQPDGSRVSLFGPDGLVPGTERGERILFWPMGIREPGAMRQWGRHPTAFVGRRHFDDARLIERYFVLDEPRLQ